VELLLSAGKILLGVAIGLCLVVYLLQDRLIFHPQPLSDAARAAVGARYPTVREIFIQNGTQKIHAWHVDAGSSAPLVLYFGGNAEDVSAMAGEVLEHAPGVSWLLVSYRGYGGSGGSPSAAALTSDALAWHDHAVKAWKPRRLLAFGRSLGSGPAVQLAGARALAGVVLVTPFDSLNAVAKRYYGYLPVDLLLKHRFESIDLAPKIEAPLLCLAAERDEVIPPDHARRLFDAWAGSKQWVLLPGANHNTTDNLPAFWQSIRPFLQKS